MPAPRSAFTLVELVVATAIMGLLMTGLASAIVLATHALPDPESPTSAILENASIADQVAEELGGALWIMERMPTAVTFAVADRDGNGLPERIRYAWSGTPGDPLTRQYNGAAEIEMLPDVEAFDVGYELQPETEEYLGLDVESGEIELKSYYSSSNLADAHVHIDRWWGQYFLPNLPAEATRWGLTRVFVAAKRDHGGDTTTLVQLRVPAADQTPGDQIVDETTIPQLSLSNSYEWAEKSFVKALGLSPDMGLCLALITEDPDSAQLLYREKSVSLPDAALSFGNPVWQAPRTDQALLFYVYGKYSTPGSPETATRQYITGARVTLQGGADPATQVVTGTRLLNCPEALEAMWETDFTEDPTLDHNGDGLPDWVVRGGAVFDVATLSDGDWTADTILDTYPGCNFTGLTTVDVRYRNASIGGDGAVFKIRVDNANGKHARVFSYLQLQADGTQTLIVSHRIDDAGTEVPLVFVTGLPDDFVTLRLMFDAGLDTVSLWVDGEQHGTHTYSRVTPDGRDYATLLASGSAAEFDYVVIRVSE